MCSRTEELSPFNSRPWERSEGLSPWAFPGFLHRIARQAQLFRMLFHAFNRDPGHFFHVHSQHFTALQNQCPVTFRCKPLILELFHETFYFEIRNSMRAHPCAGLDNAGQLVHGKQAFLHIRLRLNIRADSIAVGENRPDIRLIHPCFPQRFFRVLQMLIRIFLIIVIMEHADCFPVFFILTKMIRENMSFADALAMAQQLGYAERNPAADIEGHDASRKISILASLAYGKHVYPEYVHTDGITRITLEDVAYAASWGGVIKLIGQVKRLEDDTLDITVEPMLIEKSSQLANVDDVFNGILVRGDSTGDVVFYGKGAGKLPTASAVVADIIDCVKHLKKRKYFDWADGDASLVKPYEETSFPVYLRLKTDISKQALTEKVQTLFPNAREIVRANAASDEYAFATEEMTVGAREKALAALEEGGVQVLSKIRISDL